MSKEGEKPEVSKEADALGELLDSSAKAFAPRKTVTDDELDELMDLADQAAAQKAATQFQTFLQEMVEVQEEAMKQEKEKDSTAGGDEDEETTRDMMEAMKQLMSCAGKVASANNEEEFLASMDMLRNPDASFEPLMSIIMESLVTKDVMYPPLKELCEKYPTYLASNKDKVDAETFEKYENQFKCITKICDEFEKQSTDPTAANPDEATETDGEQPFMGDIEKIGRMLMELQTYGYPPAELLGDLPEGWGLDGAGVPHVSNVEQAANQCKMM